MYNVFNIFTKFLYIFIELSMIQDIGILSDELLNNFRKSIKNVQKHIQNKYSRKKIKKNGLAQLDQCMKHWYRNNFKKIHHHVNRPVENDNNDKDGGKSIYNFPFENWGFNFKSICGDNSNKASEYIIKYGEYLKKHFKRDKRLKYGKYIQLFCIYIHKSKKLNTKFLYIYTYFV